MLRPYVFSPDRLPGRMASGITAERLSKTFRVKVRDPGLGGALQALVRPRYRDVHAVREVTFRIGPGEIVAFLGPNGAGKPAIAPGSMRNVTSRTAWTSRYRGRS